MPISVEKAGQLLAYLVFNAVVKSNCVAKEFVIKVVSIQPPHVALAAVITPPQEVGLPAFPLVIVQAI